MPLPAGSCNGRSMNILFVNSTTTWGGGEVWLMDMLAGLEARGHNVHVVCRTGSPLARTAVAERYKTFPIRIGGDLDPLVILRVVGIMRGFHIDVVCTNTDKDLRFGGIAAKLAGVRRVVASREVDFPIKNTFAYRFAYTRLASAIVVNSEATRATISRNAPWMDGGSIRVIYKGVDLRKFDAGAGGSIRSEFGIGVRNPIVCFVGRLDEQKGVRYLLEAWPAVHRKHPAARLLVVGDGNLRGYVTDFIEAHGMQESTILAGFRDDVPSLLKECSILALPSLWEGFGYAAAEAMAAGVPVVASNTSSLPELVEDGRSGILVEPANSDALAEAIAKLLRNKTLAKRMGKRGRAIVASRFSIKAMIDSFENVFRGQPEG